MLQDTRSCKQELNDAWCNKQRCITGRECCCTVAQAVMVQGEVVQHPSQGVALATTLAAIAAAAAAAGTIISCVRSSTVGRARHGAEVVFLSSRGGKLTACAQMGLMAQHQAAEGCRLGVVHIERCQVTKQTGDTTLQSRADVGISSLLKSITLQKIKGDALAGTAARVLLRQL